MAELNFGLLTPPGSQSIGNAFAHGMDQAAVARAQENQNALSQYTLSKAQREDAQQNELYNAVRQPGFKLDIGTAMRFGAPGLAAYKAQEEATTRGVDLQIKRGTLAAQPNKQLLDESNLIDKSLDRYKGQAATVQAVPAVEAYVRRTYADPVLNPYLTKIKSEEDAIAENVAEFNANPDKWRVMHTNVSGLQILQATMPKPQVAGSSIVNMNPVPGGVGQPIAGAPPVANLATNLLIPGPNNTMVPNQQLIDVQTGLRRAGASNVNVKLPPIEGEYGKTFAKNLGEDDVKLRKAAVGATDLAANANQTLRLLDSSQVFTGGAADIKLAIAKALNVIGDTDAQAIANTEQLIRSTGKATLAAIQQSGLGTGQGFTDKDLKMLQGVEGGTIGLNADTLRAFATAQHNAAAAIVKQWETRRKGIPASALSQTGIDKETYPIEPKYSATPSGRPDVWVRGADGKPVKQ
jgi:hypothetical protein